MNDRAVAWANSHAADLVTQIDEATRNELNRVITTGIESGLDVGQIADSIHAMDAFSDKRASLIAETEIAGAESQGALEGLRELAATTDLTIQKTWVVTDEACDDCQDNEDEGPIDLDDDFPSGDDAPPAHPNCRCALGYTTEE